MHLAVSRWARRYRGSRSAAYMALLATILLGICLTMIPRGVDLIFFKVPFLSEDLQNMDNANAIRVGIKVFMCMVACYAALGPYSRVLQITMPERFPTE